MNKQMLMSTNYPHSLPGRIKEWMVGVSGVIQGMPLFLKGHVCVYVCMYVDGNHPRALHV